MLHSKSPFLGENAVFVTEVVDLSGSIANSHEFHQTEHCTVWLVHEALRVQKEKTNQCISLLFDPDTSTDDDLNCRTIRSRPRRWGNQADLRVIGPFDSVGMSSNKKPGTDF